MTAAVRNPNLYYLTVTINGGTKNPWHRLGLKQNPFPQLGRAEFNRGERQLNSLDGDPIKSEQDLRDRLVGFDPHFINGCVRRWKPGKRVRFLVTFPKPESDR